MENLVSYTQGYNVGKQRQGKMQRVIHTMIQGYRRFRGSLSKGLRLTQHPKLSRGDLNICGKSILGRADSLCKGPVLGMLMGEHRGQCGSSRVSTEKA